MSNTIPPRLNRSWFLGTLLALLISALVIACVTLGETPQTPNARFAAMEVGLSEAIQTANEAFAAGTLTQEQESKVDEAITVAMGAREMAYTLYCGGFTELDLRHCDDSQSLTPDVTRHLTVALGAITIVQELLRAQHEGADSGDGGTGVLPEHDDPAAVGTGEGAGRGP